MLKSFTLIELLVVIVVLSILAGIAVPGYIGVKQKIRDQGAKANLRLIYAAEKNYRIEARNYTTTTDTGNTNELLSLDLSDADHWAYSVPQADNSVTPATFCAEATHGEGSSIEAWHLSSADPEPAEGTCP
ncbi:MAG: type II secretion system GspH family protein [Candidatus Omnitrophica bacterium]|nr:type II secretion system GspH family protein [Candidatus Omnitrophota bacterium]